MDQYYKYSYELSKIINIDKHNKDEGYKIQSLYFDSIDDRDYQEKIDGVEVRRKIRLRNYGTDSEFAMLEMKQKQGDLQKKRSLRMNKIDAMRLINCDYSVLLQYNEPFALECYAIMNMYCYRPKTVVSYNRKAFVTKENKIRITFDYNIVANECYYDIFSENLTQNSVFDPYMVVLEIKYNGFLLSYIKDMLMECDKSEISISKYCLGRSIAKNYLF